MTRVDGRAGGLGGGPKPSAAAAPLVMTTITMINSTAAVTIIMMVPCKFMIIAKLRREWRRDRAALFAARAVVRGEVGRWRWGVSDPGPLPPKSPRGPRAGSLTPHCRCPPCPEKPVAICVLIAARSGYDLPEISATTCP